jgi:hypothetical protein
MAEVFAEEDFRFPHTDLIESFVRECFVRESYAVLGCFLSHLVDCSIRASDHFGSRQPLIPTAPTDCRNIEEGTAFNTDLFQFRLWTAQKFIIEAGSDPSGKFEFLW